MYAKFATIEFEFKWFNFKKYWKSFCLNSLWNVKYVNKNNMKHEMSHSMSQQLTNSKPGLQAEYNQLSCEYKLQSVQIATQTLR